MTTEKGAKRKKRGKKASGPGPRRGAGAPAKDSRDREAARGTVMPIPEPVRWTGRRDAFAVLALGLLVAASYFPAFQGGFIWDDGIIEKLMVAGGDLSGLARLWFAPAGAFAGLQSTMQEAHYWPLLYTTFWIEHKLWGLSPAGYHAVNILLHFANSVLLWRLMLRLAVPGAWAVAAVFAVHPLHVESVAWVIARKDLLSGLFYLLAALAWLRFAERPGPKRYLAVAALFLAGMLCKSIVVTLPAALLLWQWWKSGSVTRKDIGRLLPLFAVAAAVALADMAFSRSVESVSLGYSFADRTLIAARALWFYAGKLFWPADLAVVYPHWDVDAADPAAWAYVAAALALPACLWFLRRRTGRGPLAGTLFFGVTLFPVLGFIDYGYMQFSFVADRYQYLAGIGVIAVAVGAAAGGAGRLPGAARKAAPAILLAALAGLGAATWKQCLVYENEISYYSHIISRNPGARHAHNNLSLALRKEGRWEEALAASVTAVRQDPDSRMVLSNAGLAFAELGRFGEAEEHYRRALSLDPRHKVTLQNFGELLRKQKRCGEAIEYYRRAVRSDPGFALAHGAMGDCLFRMNRYGEAAESIRRALSLQKNSPQEPYLRSLLKQIREKTGRRENM